QVFSRSPRNWRLRELDPGEVTAFREGLASLGIAPLIVHTQYLLNLATDHPVLRRRSIESLRLDMTRAFVLGARYVVTHIGSAGEQPRQQAIESVASAVDEALRDAPEGVRLLLENSAGAGNLIGNAFSEIGDIVNLLACKSRVGTCLDVAHAFAAGYQITTGPGLEARIAAGDEHVGASRLELIHFNDSKAPCGARRDRHQHIGRGLMGREGLRLIVNHPRLRRLPFIMETPEATVEHDRRNMAAFLRLATRSGSATSWRRAPATPTL
ncbi:MAG: deoxyribonuclease IV, partial [Armatimonadota bacterium]